MMSCLKGPTLTAPLHSVGTTRGSPSRSQIWATQTSRNTKSPQCPTSHSTTPRSSKSTGKTFTSHLCQYCLPHFHHQFPIHCRHIITANCHCRPGGQCGRPGGQCWSASRLLWCTWSCASCFFSPSERSLTLRLPLTSLPP